MKYIKTFLRLLLGVLMVYVGVRHFTHVENFAPVVPYWFRFSSQVWTDFVVLASGAVEIILGLGLICLPKHKAALGAVLAIFFVLVFPGNIHQYLNKIDAKNLGLVTDTARLIRLFFQPVFIAWALWVTDGWGELKRWYSIVIKK